MDFELSEGQELMRSGLRELLERACDIRHVRAVAYNGDGRDAALWRALADAGWTALTVPEASGGAGLAYEELMIAAMEAGRAVLPLPLVTTLLAARTIVRAPAGAQREQALADIASGKTSVTLALSAARESDGDTPGLRAERDGDGWRLHGSLPGVPYGPLAVAVLLDAALPRGGRGLFLAPSSALEWVELSVMDQTVRQYDLIATGAQPATSLFGEEDASPIIDDLLDEWRVALAAESAGVCERMTPLAAEYAKERVQFGRPIGSNQAVKARIAEMAGAVERMKAAVYHAAVRIDEAADATERGLAVHMAKAAASGPGAFVGSQAIHVHGGIGFTWEHDIHIYFKRAKSNELLLGDTAASLARVADLVL